MRYKEIPTKVVLDEYFSYDPDVGTLTWKKVLSNRIKIGSVVRSINSNGYYTLGIMGEKYLAHRVIWRMMTGEDPGHMQIDHKNCDKLDNRFDNLRLASDDTNHFNLKLKSTNTSGIKGVYWNKQNKAWIGQVMLGGKVYFSKNCPTPEVAADFVRETREKLHGEFTNHGT